MDPSWLEVTNDSAKVGTYTYHLTVDGANNLMEEILPDAMTEYAPSAARLALLSGNITINQATDSAFLPKLNAHDVTVTVGTSVNTADFFTDATSATGVPLSAADTKATETGTTNSEDFKWGTPGSHAITVTLFDPTSNQTVTKQVTAVVESEEDSVATSMSEMGSQLTSQLDSQAAEDSKSRSINVMDSENASESEAVLNSKSISVANSENASLSTAETSLSDAQTSISDASKSLASDNDLSTRSQQDASAFTSMSESEASLSARTSDDITQLSEQSLSQASLSDANAASVTSTQDSQLSVYSKSLDSMVQGSGVDSATSEAMQSLSDVSKAEASQLSEQNSRTASVSATTSEADASADQSLNVSATQSASMSEIVWSQSISQMKQHMEDSENSINIASQNEVNSQSTSEAEASVSQIQRSTSTVVS